MRPILTVIIILLLPAAAQADAGAYYVDLPSGEVGVVWLSVTAGDVMIAAAVGLLAAIQLWDQIRQLAIMATKR